MKPITEWARVAFGSVVVVVAAFLAWKGVLDKRDVIAVLALLSPSLLSAFGRQSPGAPGAPPAVFVALEPDTKPETPEAKAAAAL